MQLIQFSRKIPGVCYETIATMVKAIDEENDGHSISRDSFKRMIKKGKDLGIFTVFETARENGSQSSNLYVFHRYPSL